MGPVAALIKAADEEEAIRVANDTVFGLGAAVFTRDVKRAERIAIQELQAGSWFCERFCHVRIRDCRSEALSNPDTGRELAESGIREFINVKTVYIR